MHSNALGLSRWLDRLGSRSSWSAEEEGAILTLPGTLERIAPNRDFVRLGERVDNSCLIVSGLAGRFARTRNGERLITALHIPGDMADLHSVPVPIATAALNALTETMILRIPHAALRTLGQQMPRIAEAFWRDSVVDAAIISEWALRNARLSAKARIAHLICEFSWRFEVGREGDRVTFGWPLNQSHLADMTGLTTVHANRMLRELREDGILRIKDRRAEILDWKKLRSIAEFDEQYLQLQQGPRPRI